LLTGKREHEIADGVPPFVVKLTVAVGGVSFPLPTSATATLHVQGGGPGTLVGCEEHTRLVRVARSVGGGFTAVSSAVALLAAWFVSPW